MQQPTTHEFGGRTAPGQFEQFGLNSDSGVPQQQQYAQSGETAYAQQNYNGQQMPGAMHKDQSKLWPGKESINPHVDTTTPVYEKLHQFGKLVDSIGVCMMCTRCPDTGALTSRPMQLRHRDTTDLYFLTSLHSPKLLDLARDEHINIAFLAANSGEWASLNGCASIVRWSDFSAQESHSEPHMTSGRRSFSKDLLRKIWTPAVKHWGAAADERSDSSSPSTPAMENDLAIVVVHAASVHYGVATGSSVKNAVKRVVGASPSGDNITVREITREEIEASRAAGATQGREE